jgi:hypothetical protein
MQYPKIQAVMKGITSQVRIRVKPLKSDVSFKVFHFEHQRYLWHGVLPDLTHHRLSGSWYYMPSHDLARGITGTR